MSKKNPNLKGNPAFHNNSGKAVEPAAPPETKATVDETQAAESETAIAVLETPAEAADSETTDVSENEAQQPIVVPIICADEDYFWDSVLGSY